MAQSFFVALALLARGLRALHVVPAPAQFETDVGSLGPWICHPAAAKQGTWNQPLQKSANAGPNICMGSKQVPDLYLLGAAKCATTSLAYELISAGTKCAGRIKEYHFFKPSSLKEFPRDPENFTAEWLKGMPDCSSESRVLVGDYSPESLSYTDGPGHPFNESRGQVEMPLALHQIYGYESKKLNFVVMLRQPLDRILSYAYYNMYGSMDDDGAFERQIKALITTDFTPQSIKPTWNPIWGSCYGHQVQRWLHFFDHDQFYMLPFRAFNVKPKQVCQEIAGRIKYEIDCSNARAPPEQNSNSHPALEDITSESFRQQFGEFISHDQEALLHSLQVGSQKGMGLAAYDGPAGSHGKITDWLHAWW